MEADKNPMPKFEIFPKIRKLAHFIFDHLQAPGLSEHSRVEAPEVEAYEQPQLDFEAQADKGF